MNVKKSPFSPKGIYRIGYFITLFGTAAILLWLGIFKFTPTEAAAIEPLIANHPLAGWLYDVFSLQAVSNAVGVVEIAVALTLLLSVKFRSLKPYAASGIIIIFAVTLSFLFFTPGIWKVLDGIPVTNYFILKDVVYLGFGFMLLDRDRSKKNTDTR